MSLHHRPHVVPFGMAGSEEVSVEPLLVKIILR